MLSTSYLRSGRCAGSLRLWCCSWIPVRAVNQLGFLMDTLGGFFLLRFAVRDRSDIRRTVNVLVFVAALVASGMVIERIARVNAFGYLGSLPTAPQVRGVTLRAQGPFAHPILAGTFGATLLPLFVWLWVGPRRRVLGTLGIASSTAITVLSASSTPIMAFAAGAFGICMWPLRRRLAILRWGFVSLIGALALVMKAPVWFLIARVDVVGGSSGYHRAMLIDQFIRRFSDWWLIGTAANADWGAGLWDTCNQFVTEGETGGLVTLACFVILIWVSFQRVGEARRASVGDRKEEWFYWLLGTALFAQVVAFFGIAYFDQTRLVWFALLAIVIAATGRLTRAEHGPRGSAESDVDGLLGPRTASEPLPAACATTGPRDRIRRSDGIPTGDLA